MTQKLYVKPPKQAIGGLLLMAFIVTMFLLGGLIAYFNLFDEIQGNPEFLPITIFFIIWSVICGGLFVHFIKLYTLMKKGKIEIGEIGNSSDSGSRLRNLDSLKKDGHISNDEYNSKRKEIMDEKW